MFQTRREKILSKIVLGIYLFLLTWLVLFKLRADFGNLPCIRSLNLIPFGASVLINDRIDIREILYNLVAFVPLGVYVQVFHPNRAFRVKALPGLWLSFSFEALQFMFAIGASDITDLISNTLGGVLGILICMVMQRLFKKNTPAVVNAIGITVEAAAFALITVLTLANL